MADQAPLRKNVQSEETDFRFAVSESNFKKVGGSINFINNYQYDTFTFNGNGSYGTVLTSIGTFPATAFDNIYVAPFDVEVMGLFIRNGESGSSGTTTLDIHKLTGGTTDAGTIFTVKPAVTSAAANGSYDGFIYDPVAASITTFHSLAAFTVGTFTSTPFDLDQGEALRADIDAVQGGTPRNISISLFLRPR